MKLYLDPRGGMAGDMFSAVLISAGAKAEKMIDIMEYAASELGSVRISVHTTDDGSTQLKIDLASRSAHLSSAKAGAVLDKSFARFEVPLVYRALGHRILTVLLEAEKKAHLRYNISLNPESHHHHHGKDESWLHEAQDIVIDITGAVMGLWHLNIDLSNVIQTHPISVGGGTIHFSHGTFRVPAPATEEILSRYRMFYTPGPIDTELCTPTGAAIMAALDPLRETAPGRSPSGSGTARGSKILEIPPLKITIFDE